MSEIENEKIKALLKAAAAEFNLAEIIILAEGFARGFFKWKQVILRNTLTIRLGGIQALDCFLQRQDDARMIPK